MSGIVINNAANTINNTTVVAPELTVSVDPYLKVIVITLASGFYWSGTGSIIYSAGDGSSNVGSWTVAMDFLNNTSTSNVTKIWNQGNQDFEINSQVYNDGQAPVLNVTNIGEAGASLYAGTWSDGVSAYIIQGATSSLLPISQVVVSGTAVHVTVTGYSGSDTSVAFGGITNTSLTALNGVKTVTSISGDVITITQSGLTAGTYTTGLGFENGVNTQNVEVSLSGNTITA